MWRIMLFSRCFIWILGWLVLFLINWLILAAITISLSGVLIAESFNLMNITIWVRSQINSKAPSCYSFHYQFCSITYEIRTSYLWTKYALIHFWYVLFFIFNLRRDIFPSHVKLYVRNDAVAALASGTMGRLRGCVLIAGTGTIAYGFTDDGREARAAGAGPILGDWGRSLSLTPSYGRTS